MRYWLYTLFLLTSVSLQAQKEIYIDAIPDNIEDFLKFRDRVATTPEGGAAVFAVAMMMYTKDKDLGIKAFTIAGHRDNLRESDDGYKGFEPGQQYGYMIRQYFGPKPYIAKSYMRGTKPEQQYKLPKGKLYMDFSRNKYSEMKNGDIKVFIKCTGAATPRPMTLRKNNRGIWKVHNYSSMFVGVVPPADDTDDDL